MDFKLFVILSHFIYNASCYNILLIFPTAAPSHFFLGNSLAIGLANAGNDITMVSAYENKIPLKNGSYTTVLLTEMEKALMNCNLPTWRALGEMSSFKCDYYLTSIGGAITNFTLNHPNFKKLINSNKKFDVIIIEQFLNDGLIALSCHYKAPLISLTTFVPTIWVNYLTGNSNPPSYVPDVLTRYSSDMNLYQRAYNSMFSLFRYLNYELKHIPQQQELIKDHFPECYPVFRQTLHNTSLVFVNTHESVTYPVPLVPNMINIGGYHLNPSNKKLPGDLQKFMDDAKEGVIYFSTGTNMNPSDLGPESGQLFLNVFKKLKQKVLWKWDKDISKGEFGNIKIQEFFPQQDILAHPNTKLFITHGGLLSKMEAIYHAVPLLNIPVFGDQKTNAAKSDMDEISLTIHPNDLTEENLLKALENLLKDPKYKINMQKKSSVFHDRPIKPMDLAIYWTEFIAKRGGAPHLRVAGLNLKWYQYYLLDVVGLGLIIVLIGFILLYMFLKRIKRTANKVKVN